MSADKYPSIFSRQMKAMVYIVWDFRRRSRVVLNSFNSSRLKVSRQSAVVFPNKLLDTDIGDKNG